MMLPRLRAAVLSSVLMSLAALCTPAAAADPPAPAQRLGPVLERIQREGRIVLAYREASVPFSYLDGSGRPIGFALDICLRLVAAIQSRVRRDTLAVDYLPVNSATRFEAIERGRAQLECGSTTSNSLRRERVEFTIPHFITGARMLVKANSGIDRIDQPEVKRVAITRNTTPLAAVRRIQAERGLRFEIVETEDHEKAVQMVERGEAQVFVMDDVLLYGLASTRPDPKALKVVGRFITTEPLAIMLPKGDPAFKKIIDDEMRRLIYSHEIHAIYQRWFEQPIPPNNLPMNLPISYLLRDFWKYPTADILL